MKYRESEEMYLETILLLSASKSEVHAIDISNELGYAKSSVSRAVGLLEKAGYITIERTGEIRFTEAGRERARGVYRRHRVITMLLELTGADEKLAEENACRIEHVISQEMFDVLDAFAERRGFKD